MLRLIVQFQYLAPMEVQHAHPAILHTIDGICIKDASINSPFLKPVEIHSLPQLQNRLYWGKSLMHSQDFLFY